jgi:23S rRNA (guanine2445-N2)-methyltransferase / 23S rRNA (guanine2069-N7)-methyltransferase
VRRAGTPRVRFIAPRGRGTATIFVRVPRFLEELLARELTALGAENSVSRAGGVQLEADLALAYRICLYSRLASRVLWPLAAFPAADADALYAGVAALPWPDLLVARSTLAVGFDGHSPALRHSGFAQQRIKDAVVDSLVAAGCERPQVDLEQPDIRLQAVLHRDRVTLYLDLAGTPLHRRGWRVAGGDAPLKENLAAALLLHGGWCEGRDDWLMDPMCGSGTLLVEGAWIAAGIPPGLLRERYGFQSWVGHDADLLDRLRAGMRERHYGSVRISGRDRDPLQIERTRTHLVNAGWGRWFDGELDLAVGELREWRRPVAFGGRQGLVVTNPPYGHRMNASGILRELGSVLQQEACGSEIALIVGAPGAGAGSSNPAPASAENVLRPLGLGGLQSAPCRNGPLDAWMITGTVSGRTAGDDWVDEVSASGAAVLRRAQTRALPEDTVRAAEMFGNRLRKNLQHWTRWARRMGTDAFRLYDRDLPEYALIIDCYGQDLCVQELAAPGTIDPEVAEARRDAALRRIPEVTGRTGDQIHFRLRRRQRPETQYERLVEHRAFGFGGVAAGAEVEPGPGRGIIHEGEARFLVNFEDYLDTGLYLDSRGVRRMISRFFADRSLAQGMGRRGQRMLNLYAYTGTASVQAALAGADRTTNVDLSRNYLAWAQANFRLNGLDPERHEFVRADVLEWLTAFGRGAPRYDLILLDPPTFSNSSRLEQDLDVQRDHPALLSAALNRLNPDGCLFFLNHARRFRMDWTPPDGFALEEITGRSLDADCSRGRPMHRCWRLFSRS